jgi:hypothetical protein
MSFYFCLLLTRFDILVIRTMFVKRLGLALAILGILPYLTMQSWGILQQRTYEPLKYPLSLQLGSITSPEFTVRASTEYLILLEFDRSLEFQRMQCLLGLVEWQADKKCRNIPEVVDVSWRVLSDGRPNSSGSSRDAKGGAYSDTIAKIIGYFDGIKGQHNVVLLDIRRDGSELHSAAPRLVVQVHPSYWKGTAIWIQLTFYWAVIVGGAGLVIVGGRLLVRAMRRVGHSLRGRSNTEA